VIGLAFEPAEFLFQGAQLFDSAFHQTNQAQLFGIRKLQ